MSRLAAGAASATVGALIGIGVLVAIGHAAQQPETIAPVAAAATESTPAASAVATTPASEAPSRSPRIARPVRVVIPAIDVDADLTGVGLNPDSSMQVPDFGHAAWYRPGPRPGEPGPAVIVAHVDSVAGPDVFYRLKDLTTGDKVMVQRADGTRSTFVVRDSEQQLKDQLPVDRIWNDTDDVVLRLVTCGGDFDPQRRSYRSNVIVYAESSSA